MRNTLILILFFTLGSSQISSAQESHATEGTFQLMTTNPIISQVVASDLYVMIEEYRLPNEPVLVQLSDDSWVKILSLEEISSPNFTPLPEVYWILGGEGEAELSTESIQLEKLVSSKGVLELQETLITTEIQGQNSNSNE